MKNTNDGEWPGEADRAKMWGEERGRKRIARKKRMIHNSIWRNTVERWKNEERVRRSDQVLWGEKRVREASGQSPADGCQTLSRPELGRLVLVTARSLGGGNEDSEDQRGLEGPTRTRKMHKSVVIEWNTTTGKT